MNITATLSNTCIRLALAASVLVLYSETAFSQSTIGAPQHSLVRPETRTDKCKKPQWPVRALDGGQEGGVQIAVMVGTDGKPVRTTVQHSTGFPMLDAATAAALMKCSFTPGTVDGESVSMLMTTSYYWFSSNPGEPGEHWMKVLRAAQDGEVPALYTVAQWQTKDPDTISNGIKLLKILANAGYPLAQYEIGARYEAGDGLEKDIEQAEIWYSKAAEQGELLAAERLHLMQERGVRDDVHR